MAEGPKEKPEETAAPKAGADALKAGIDAVPNVGAGVAAPMAGADAAPPNEGADAAAPKLGADALPTAGADAAAAAPKAGTDDAAGAEVAPKVGVDAAAPNAGAVALPNEGVDATAEAAGAEAEVNAAGAEPTGDTPKEVTEGPNASVGAAMLVEAAAEAATEPNAVAEAAPAEGAEAAWLDNAAAFALPKVKVAAGELALAEETTGVNDVTGAAVELNAGAEASPDTAGVEATGTEMTAAALDAAAAGADVATAGAPNAGADVAPTFGTAGVLLKLRRAAPQLAPEVPKAAKVVAGAEAGWLAAAELALADAAEAASAGEAALDAAPRLKEPVAAAEAGVEATAGPLKRPKVEGAAEGVPNDDEGDGAPPQLMPELDEGANEKVDVPRPAG